MKEFLIDVVKQADVASRCSDRSLDNVLAEWGSVEAHPPSTELLLSFLYSPGYMLVAVTVLPIA